MSWISSQEGVAIAVSDERAVTDSPLVIPAPGKPLLLLGAFDIGSLGYVAEEFFVSGTASSYTHAAEVSPDGRWSVTPSGAADYTTRIVVLTPFDRAQFNGTVLVEWLNVSGGIDAPAVWMMAHREIIRAGYAYVAVSAQRVGVEGGASLLGMDMSLKSQDPKRYAIPAPSGRRLLLRHLFPDQRTRQECRSTTACCASSRVQHVVAVGESQSAMFLTTYINAVDPLAQIYDGFLVHSRFAGAAPLDGEFHIRRIAEPACRKRSTSVPTCASRSLRSSPRPTSSAACDMAITSRGSRTTNGCGSGRLRAPLTPTTTRSRWRRSTAARHHSMTSWRPTRRPTC